MKKLIRIADEYAKQSTWKDFALVKFCLLALGIILGTQVCEKKKKSVIWVSVAVFIATYIPLMVKFVSFFFACQEDEEMLIDDSEIFMDYIPE